MTKEKIKILILILAINFTPACCFCFLIDSTIPETPTPVSQAR